MLERLQASVGRGGINRFDDSLVVQTLINECLFLLRGVAPLSLDGRVGPRTVDAIDEFQKQVVRLSNPDGRVDPSGRTLRTLNTHRRPLSTNAPVVHAGRPTGYRGGGPPRSPVGTGLTFPLDFRPAQSYKNGGREFGARRSGNRLHAGCDFIAPVGTPVYAIADGEVVQDPYRFYDGTWALEVWHGSFLARYGEIQQAVPRGIRAGAKVERGQLIGRIGWLIKLKRSMLHFELYSGQARGALTQVANRPYQRRSDLVDPTTTIDLMSMT
jgi:murein DD-endopeptidase MepM/ murein hydrolase activator NlpD